MADLSAEIRVVIHAHDQPAAHMDHGELALMPTGCAELVLYVNPQDTDRWLAQLLEEVRRASASIQDHEGPVHGG